MEDTCRGKNCWFYQVVGQLQAKAIEPDFQDCPFYIETIWNPPDKGSQVRTTKDCSCKRVVFSLHELALPQLKAVQKAEEESRNKFDQYAESMMVIMNAVSLAKNIGIQINKQVEKKQNEEI